MAIGEWKNVEEDFSARAEKGTVGVGGESRYFIKFNSEPYKAVYESGDVTIHLTAFSDPDLVKPPGMFNVEYCIKGRNDYELKSFSKMSELKEWFDEKGVKNRPDIRSLYEKMIAFTNKIIKVNQDHDFGISAWAKEWLESLG